MRRVALLVALLVVLAAPPPVASAQADPSVSPSGTLFVVELQQDGDARWTVNVSYSLAGENETEAFRAYGQAFVDGEAEAAPSIAFFERAVAMAENVTGREMAIESPERSFEVREAGEGDAASGSLLLSFTWTNFLERTENRTYVLGDALRIGENRTWLRTLGPDQTLRVISPPEYSITSTGEFQVSIRDGGFVVEGPRSFVDEGPLSVTYEYTGPPTSPPTTSPPGSPTGPGLPDGLPAVLALLLALLVVVGAVAWRRGDDEDGATGGVVDGDDTDRDAPSGRPSAPDERTEPTDGDRPEEEAESAGGADGEAEAESAETEPELLSDEERVERLLERNGGRMRQADIVAETDWSDAKVSQLLSRMAEEGRVEKLRLGRENLISLPDHEE